MREISASIPFVASRAVNCTPLPTNRWFDIQKKQPHHIQKLNIFIEECPIHSYRLTGRGIESYWEEALEWSNRFYLDMYDKVYRDLMAGEFNPVWTPDTTSVNDLDFKDDFGSVSYLIFNMFLLKLLAKKQELNVVDNTEKRFRDQRLLFKFLRKNQIEFKLNDEKKANTSFKNRQKKRVLKFVKKMGSKFINHFRPSAKEIRSEYELQGSKTANETIYFYVHPCGDMKLSDYVNWRYSSILNEIDTDNRQLIFLSTRDFDDAEEFKHPFFNVNRLLSREKEREIHFRSFLLKIKILIYKGIMLLKSRDAYKTAFLEHLPTQFFNTMREYEGLNHLFELYGKGVLFIKGPVNNKGVSIVSAQANHHDIRVSVIQPRIFTEQRLSNQYTSAQYDPNLPHLIPDSMVLYDQISSKTIKSQTDKIHIYSILNGIGELHDLKGEAGGGTFTVTLTLQRSDEVGVMVNHVVNALTGLKGITLNLKEHPVFKAPESVKSRFEGFPWVHLLDSDVSLQSCVISSDLCISSYSSAALEFAAGGCPIIWMKNVTLNSIFFSDVQDTIGIEARSATELAEVVRSMKNNPANYNEEREKQYKVVREEIYNNCDNMDGDFEDVVRSEFRKVQDET